MASKLSAQDKLALALTSAGSMRKLAAQIGITHQKLGRWLREGEAGGVKSIPADLFTQAAIDTVFSDHVRTARERAKADRIPFNAAAPVYMERKPLASGDKGDRVFAENTQFIRSATRTKVMQGAHDSKKFYSASVRSVVNLRSYFRKRAAEDIARRGRTDVSVNELAKIIEQGFKQDTREQHNRTIDAAKPFALYTQREGLLIGRKGDTRTIRGIEKKLREKHEPATGQPGTVLADMYLFQLTPADYAPTPTRRQRRKPTTKRGK